MLVKATYQDIETYGEFVYSVAQDLRRSAYPTFADGISTKEEFFQTARRSIESENYELLLYFSENKMEGFISYFWIEEDNYLQLFSCNINSGTAQALTELVVYLEENFKEYEWYFGFPKGNQEAVEFLQKYGFSCIEDDYDTNIDFANYELREENKNVVRVTQENFEDFRFIHSLDEVDTYWTCERIYEKLDTWDVYVCYEDSVPAGVMFFTGDEEYLEIYGIEYKDGAYREDIFTALMITALNEGKRRGTKYMTYFCENEVEAVKNLGFRLVSPYVCYCKKPLPDNMKFRKVIENDYDFIYQVKREVYQKYVEQYYGKWDEKQQREYFKTFIETYKDGAFVITLDGQDIGFYNGTILENGYEIGNICILPEYQNRGIGTTVLKELLLKHADKTISLQYFKSNPVGKLYENLGFRRVGETEYHYQMVKRLH